MAKLWKKQESIFSKIQIYFEKTDKTRDVFKKTVSDLINKDADASLADAVEDVHAAEHEADNERRAVILELYKKALIPESRGDILGLLESFDSLPNTFQAVCNIIFFQNIKIPENYKARFIDLINVNIEAYNLTKDAAFCLFKEEDLLNKCELVCDKERESDTSERALIRDIYSSDMDLAEKMQLKEVIIAIGNISDLAEDVSDRIELAIIKRKI